MPRSLPPYKVMMDDRACARKARWLRLAAFTGLLVVTTITSNTTYAFSSGQYATGEGTIACPSAIEIAIVDMLNQERAAIGLPALEVDTRLAETSRLHSLDMATNDFFSHSGSNGSSFIDRLERAGYPWQTAGENIAAGYRDAESVVNGWMGSPGHRANVLNSRFQHVGIGYAYDSGSTYDRYYTADFGASSDRGSPLPAGCSTSPTPTPTSTPVPIPDLNPVFADVPLDHPFRKEIETLYQAGYTVGCDTDPLRYCPDRAMTRAESAVFVLRGIYGVTVDPGDPKKQIFSDLPLSFWATAWVTTLYQDGYTAGCSMNPQSYCPNQAHTRAEGAVFYLRMINGADFVPPQPKGTFADVPLNAWYAKWVEAADDAGLIQNCGQDPLLFCPEEPLTRAVAAYMMVQATGLDNQRP